MDSLSVPLASHQNHEKATKELLLAAMQWAFSIEKRYIIVHEHKYFRVQNIVCRKESFTL